MLDQRVVRREVLDSKMESFGKVELLLLLVDLLFWFKGVQSVKLLLPGRLMRLSLVYRTTIKLRKITLITLVTKLVIFIWDLVFCWAGGFLELWDLLLLVHAYEPLLGRNTKIRNDREQDNFGEAIFGDFVFPTLLKTELGDILTRLFLSFGLFLFLTLVSLLC